MPSCARSGYFMGHGPLKGDPTRRKGRSGWRDGGREECMRDGFNLVSLSLSRFLSVSAVLCISCTGAGLVLKSVWSTVEYNRVQLKSTRWFYLFVCLLFFSRSREINCVFSLSILHSILFCESKEKLRSETKWLIRVVVISWISRSSFLLLLLLVLFYFECSSGPFESSWRFDWMGWF